MTATIAFIGLGRMGCLMAVNLVKAGYRVVDFDVRLAQDASLQAGATTPLRAMAAQIYGLFEKLGNADVDFSGLIHVLREKAAQQGSAE